MVRRRVSVAGMMVRVAAVRRAGSGLKGRLRFRLHCAIVGALALLACGVEAFAAVTDGPLERIEEVSLLSALVMLGFLLIAALVAISFVCKIVIAMGLVSKSRASWLGRTISVLAGATGDLRVVASSCGRAGEARGGQSRGGGGSAGGAGASGDLG